MCHRYGPDRLLRIKALFFVIYLYNNFNGLSHKGNLWNENCNACSEDQEAHQVRKELFMLVIGVAGAQERGKHRDCRKGGLEGITGRGPTYWVHPLGRCTHPSVQWMHGVQEKTICPIDDDFSSVYDTFSQVVPLSNCQVSVRLISALISGVAELKKTVIDP